jgi:dienelactone hydrolase
MKLFAFVTLALLAGDARLEPEFHSFGPVQADIDLRTMLTDYVVDKSCATLDATATRRSESLRTGAWENWRDTVRESVRQALGPMPFGADGAPLNVRVVSTQERPGYVLENVLFESLPGLDVNASVYLPLASDFPPPWRGIVVPVGHSAKTGVDYQRPAQVFARRGYVAITFDPPGMAGEKPVGNDHFRDGVRCYLTGQSSNRYFVVDALRCIDYLASRDDVDMTNGVGMTGVSGGGMTTMFATLLDDRIAASGPACCAVPLAMHPVLDGYAPCPETLDFGRFLAYDDMDVLAAAVPTPVLLMAGATDEVFTADMSRRIAEDMAESFRAAGFPDRFEFFLGPGGHAYTLAMAERFADWMDRWVKGSEGRPSKPFTEADLETLPPDALACHPRQDVNIFAANRAEAERLRASRTGDPIEAARRLAGVDDPIGVPNEKANGPALVWFHYVQELLLEPEPGIALPATFLYPADEDWRGGVVLYFDDRGRWTDLRTQGLLTKLARFIDRDQEKFAVMTVDLRGWGDTKPADQRYDMAGWGSREQWLAYTSAALGDSVMAMRIRDGLATLAYLRSHPEIDPERIVIGGRGLGAVIALHVAAIDGNVAGAFALDGLATFESLAATESYTWSPEAFYPNVLIHYDLPELVSALPMPVLIANPLDATKNSLTQEDAEQPYRRGEDDAQIRVVTESGDSDVVAFVHALLSDSARD